MSRFLDFFRGEVLQREFYRGALAGFYKIYGITGFLAGFMGDACGGRREWTGISAEKALIFNIFFAFGAQDGTMVKRFLLLFMVF